MILVRRCSEATDEVCSALHRLMVELGGSHARLRPECVRRMVADADTAIFVATDRDGAIRGTATVLLKDTVQGRRAELVDTVVLPDFRSSGIGCALIQAGIEFATASGAAWIDLTSRPSRKEANRLYRRAGFAPRATNVYRLVLTPAAD